MSHSLLEQSLQHYSKFMAIMATRKKEDGQGTLEYVGMVFVAAALVLMVINGVKGGDITGSITAGIKKVISNAGG